MAQEKQIEPFKLIGVAIKTTNKNGQAMADIGQAWERFYSEALHSKIPAKVDEDIYAVYTDYQSDYQGKYTFILGCKVSSLAKIPNGFEGRTFKGGRYLKYIAKGKMPDAVANQWEKIWQDEDKLDRAYACDFEVYSRKYQNPDNAEVDLYIGTK